MNSDNGIELVGAQAADLGSIMHHESVSDQINRVVETHQGLSGFLPQATQRLIASTDKLTVDIGSRAVEIAATRSATAIDVDDVRSAEAEVTNTRKVAELEHAAAEASDTYSRGWWLTVAGLLGGAGVGVGATLGLSTSAPDYAPIWWVAVIVLLSIASFIMYKYRPRRP